MNIAIIGSAIKDYNEENINLAKEIGRILGDIKCTILTGASIGLPHEVVLEGKNKGAFTIGYYPTKDDVDIHKYFDLEKIQDFNEVIFEKGFTKRSLKMIENSDAVIVLSGRMGTLSEFSIAFEEKKPIIVFENTGGIASHIKKICKFTKKDSNIPIFFGKDPNILLEKLFRYIQKKKK